MEFPKHSSETECFDEVVKKARERYWGRKRAKEEVQEIFARLYNFLNKFLTKYFDEARKEAIERYLGRKCTKEEVQEDIHTSLLKVQRMLNQARLGADLRRRHEGTILWENQSETEHVVSKNKKLQITISGRDQSTKHVVSKTKELQMDEKANIITLDDLKIFPKVGEQGGEAIVGTLEVHVNGFLCATSSPNFSFSFLYADVAKAFFRVEDEEMPPLLHFHLHDPIKLGTEKRQNIQLRLVMNPMGQKRSYDDSDKIKKDKQTRDRVHNKDLKNFVHNVQEKWDHIPVFHCYPFGDAS